MGGKLLGGFGILLPNFKSSKLNHPWQRLLAMGLGLLMASYWLVYGFLTVLTNGGETWTQWYSSLLPGMGLLFLVLMARRAPLPYGSGLMIIGLFSLVLGVIRQMSVLNLLGLAVPVMGVGLIFIMWRRFFSPKANEIK